MVEVKNKWGCTSTPSLDMDKDNFAATVSRMLDALYIVDRLAKKMKYTNTRYFFTPVPCIVILSKFYLFTNWRISKR